MDSRVCRLRTVVMRIYSLWYMVWCYDVCSTVRKRIYWIFDIYFAHSVLLRLYPQYQQTNHSCNMPSWSKKLCVYVDGGCCGCSKRARRCCRFLSIKQQKWFSTITKRKIRTSKSDERQLFR